MPLTRRWPSYFLICLITFADPGKSNHLFSQGRDVHLHTLLFVVVYDMKVKDSIEGEFQLNFIFNTYMCEQMIIL